MLATFKSTAQVRGGVGASQRQTVEQWPREREVITEDKRIKKKGGGEGYQKQHILCRGQLASINASITIASSQWQASPNFSHWIQNYFCLSRSWNTHTPSPSACLGACLQFQLSHFKLEWGLPTVTAVWLLAAESRYLHSIRILATGLEQSSICRLPCTSLTHE